MIPVVLSSHDFHDGRRLLEFDENMWTASGYAQEIFYWRYIWAGQGKARLFPIARPRQCSCTNNT